MYIIYHIPGEKVGCTTNLDSRKRGYWDGSEFEILDLVSDDCGPEFAGDVEHAWADYFGYRRGPHYSTNSWDHSLTPSIRREAGIKTGNSESTTFRNFTPEQQSEFGKLGAKAANLGHASPEDREKHGIGFEHNNWFQ